MGTRREERPSDSPFVDTIGHFRVEDAYAQVCPADVRWNMLLVRQNGKTCLAVWGPETQSAPMNFPKDTEFLFIRFTLGTFMPHLSIRELVNTGNTLPDATSQSFWLHGSAWQYPDYENADTFVARLVREGLLAHEALVDDVLQDHTPQALASRTVRHRFLRATGLTRSYIRQIERAKEAAALLERGVPILDTVHQLGYADQPHMTRSLKRFVGQTPAQVAHANQPG